MAIPIIFNDDPSNLIQVSMSGSVGQGGVNKSDDVILIQRLLNSVPTNNGGPATKLVVDGLSGTKTIGSITHFQQRHALRADGRIDPGKGTMKKLIPLLRSQNLLPNNLSNLRQPDPKIVSAITGRSASSFAGLQFDPQVPTKWKFVGSGSASLSVSLFGVSAGDFLVVPDDQPGLIHRLTFLGVTVGLSAMPIGLDIGFESMKSVGSRIKRKTSSILRYDSASDFVGSCNFVTVSASVGPGASGSVVQFIGGLSSGAFGFVAGGQVGVPDIGIQLCVGAIAGFR